MIAKQVKWPEEAFALVLRAAALTHSTYSSFIRQTAIEKARLILGLEPKLPIYKEGSRVRTTKPQRENKM